MFIRRFHHRPHLNRVFMNETTTLLVLVGNTLNRKSYLFFGADQVVKDLQYLLQSTVQSVPMSFRYLISRLVGGGSGEQ